MDNGLNSLKTSISAKKMKRMESKKKKLAAFLNLVTGNNDLAQVQPKRQKTFHVELSETKTKTIGATSENVPKVNEEIVTPEKEKSLDKLREEIRLYQNTVVKKPSVYLTNLGLLGRINIDPKSKIEEEIPILTFNLQDIQDILLLATIGRDSFVKTRFCTLFNFTEIQTTTLLILEGISCQEYLTNKSKFAKTGKIFEEAVQLSILDNFYKEFMWDSLSDVTNVTPIEDNDNSTENRCTKVDLILSPVQMLSEGYPLPNERVFNDFKHTKDRYEHVSNDSPLFALDCEMVQTSQDPRALARVAIVDESLETIYDTFVIPPAKITNYLTEYSGVTENSLKGVTKTLKDVQNDIRNLIPNDAILCGQSLNFDLICLKLFHPYIIDTSTLFNLSGNAGQKHKLKVLADYFLDEEIQSEKRLGHDPCEDSLACMKLILLKLNYKRTFGDVTLGWQLPVEPGKEKPPLSGNLLQKIWSKDKKISISARSKHLKRYKRECNWEKVKNFKGKVLKDISDSVLNRMWVDDLVLAHFKCDLSEIKEVDNIIDRLFSSAPDRTLFLVIFTGNMDGSSEETGLCMTKVKRK